MTSDLHLDYNQHKFSGDILKVFIDVLKENEVECLLIAGDISNDYNTTTSIINEISKNVIVKYVPGNHELISNSVYNKFKADCNCLCENDYKFGDYVVIGDAGWYDYSFHKTNLTNETLKQLKKSYWYDGKYCKLDVSDISFCNIMLDKFEKKLELYKDKKVILINHFVPYEKFLVYKGTGWEITNSYIGTKKLGEMIDKYDNIEYVLFGHTHHRFGKVDKCICNPLGYYFEFNTSDIKKEFNDSLFITDLYTREINKDLYEKQLHELMIKYQKLKTENDDLKYANNQMKILLSNKKIDE